MARTIYQLGGDCTWSQLLVNGLFEDAEGTIPTTVEDGDELVLQDNIAMDVAEIPGNGLKLSKITTSAAASAGNGSLSGRGIDNFSYTINADEIVPTKTNLIQLGALNGAISVTINGNVSGSNTNTSICGVVFTNTTGYTLYPLTINGNVTGGTFNASAFAVSIIESGDYASFVEVLGNVTATGGTAINSTYPMFLSIRGDVSGSSTQYQYGVKNGTPAAPAAAEWTTIYGNVINTSKANALNCSYTYGQVLDTTYIQLGGVKAALPLTADKILEGTVNGEVEGAVVVPSTSDVRRGAAVGSASANNDVQPVGQMPNAFAF